MSVKTILVFLFLMITMSLSIGARAPSLAESSPAVKEEEVRQFIDEYKDRFMKMEIDGFMALFLKDATENRMLPYADIEEAYRRTVSISQSISFQVEIYTIQTYSQSAFVSGRYEIIQTFKGIWRRRAFRGDIQWVLVQENGSLRIKEINYSGGNPLR
jgi:uncharacterized protein YxeA